MNYGELTIMASGLLKEFGAEFTFERATEGAFSPTTGDMIPVITTWTGYGVIGSFDFAHVNETIRQGDFRLTLESTTVPPMVGDTVNGFTIVNVAAVVPNMQEVIVYECHCRL
jgi:hypothetical protein